MKIQYVADDGTPFNTEAECKEYEGAANRGAHPRFVMAVDSALSSITDLDGSATRILFFENDVHKTKVAIAIARNLDKLVAVYEGISTERKTFNKKAKK
jgi:hypothetical protein